MERQAKDGTIYQRVGNDEWQEITRVAKDGTIYKKVGQDEWSPKTFSTDSYSPENIEATKQQSASNLRKAGEFVMDKVVDPVLTAIDYTAAPVRQALAAPAKAARGDVIGAVIDPFTQLAKSPKEAPTSAQVAELYGVPKEKKVSAMAVSNPLMASTYENDPSEDDTETTTIYPSAQAGALLDAAFGGAGIDALTKGITKTANAVRGSESIAKAGSSLKQKIVNFQSQRSAAQAESAAQAKAAISGGGSTVEQSAKMFEYQAPKSLDELKNWKPEAGTGTLIGKDRLKQIETSVPDLNTKPLKYHYDMMENPKAMKSLKLEFENLPTDDAVRIANYNQEIVDESARKIKQTINDITGKEPRNLSDTGNDFIATVKDKYNSEKGALGPEFEAFKKSAKPLDQAEAQNLAVAISENSKVGKLLDINPANGKFYLKKNTPRTGMSDAEHSVISKVVDDLNDGMTFEELQRSREFLRKSIDPANPGASDEVQKIRTIMLNQLELMAEKQGQKVGSTFKGYAQNERAREAMEKIIGGKIESLDAMYAANPDKVVQKIFANPNYAKTVQDYVGPEKMKEMVASYLNQGVSKAFDQANGFEPHKLRNWLKTNENFIRTHVDPKTAERLNALADYGMYGKRFLQEVNPSGTAASIKEMLKPGTFMQKVRTEGITGAVTSETIGRVSAMAKQKQAKKIVNELMGTPKPKPFSAKEAFQKAAGSVDGSGKIVPRAALTAKNLLTESVGVQNVADKKKGPEKWANEGADRLKKHDSSLSSEIIEKLKNDIRGRELLYQASELKPGSKAMENIKKRIRTGFLNKGDQ